MKKQDQGKRNWKFTSRGRRRFEKQETFFNDNSNDLIDLGRDGDLSPVEGGREGEATARESNRSG